MQKQLPEIKESYELSTRQKIKLVIAFALLIGGFKLWEWQNERIIRTHGVYSKALVIAYTPKRKGRGIIKVSYSYNNRKFQQSFSARRLGKASAVGKEFFIQFMREDPLKAVFLYDKRVPYCLSKTDAPPMAWDTLPSCPVNPSDDMLMKWRNDSLGCLGYRNEQTFREVDAAYDLHNKLPVETRQILGPPNLSYASGNAHTMIYYFNTCCINGIMEQTCDYKWFSISFPDSAIGKADVTIESNSGKVYHYKP